MRASILVLLLVTGCGAVKNAEPKPEATPGAVSGAGRVKGGRYTMDVQVGAAAQPASSSSGSVRLQTSTTPAK